MRANRNERGPDEGFRETEEAREEEGAEDTQGAACSKACGNLSRRSDPLMALGTVASLAAGLTSYGSTFSLRASSGGFWRRGDVAEAQALLESLLPRAREILDAQIPDPVLG